jgi:hypothetical protein
MVAAVTATAAAAAVVFTIICWAAAAPAASSPPASTSDCSLNGQWTRGHGCLCDPGWRGTECGQLDLQPVPSLEAAGYWNASQPSWGASPLFDKRRVAMPDQDGRMSLFASVFAGGCGLNAWQDGSYIARLRGSERGRGFGGEFSLEEEVILPPEAHNPEVLVHGGNISVFVYGGCTSKPRVCNASHPNPHFPRPSHGPGCGPSGSRFTRPYPSGVAWHRTPLRFVLSNQTDGAAAPFWWKGCSLHNTNPSPLLLEGGGVLMAVTSNCPAAAGSVSGEYTLVGRGESLDGPFVIDAQGGGPVFGTGPATDHSEDGYLYRNRRGFHMLAHGMNVYSINSGRHAWSRDGVHWRSAPDPAYGPEVFLSAGGVEVLIRRERPKLVLDAEGHPTFLINGVQRAMDILGGANSSHTLVQPVRRRRRLRRRRPATNADAVWRAAPTPPVIVAPYVTVFNATFDTCNASAHDNVDSPARAFSTAAPTSAAGESWVTLVASARTSRVMTGPSLRKVAHRCDVVHRSTNDSSPSNFADNEWLHSTYALDNDTVFGLLHNEYHGWQHEHCASGADRKVGRCQMFSLTAAVSRDGGKHWQHLHPPPHHLIATPPYRYNSTALWFGFGDSGGIVQSPRDGYFYTTGHNRATVGDQINGTCLMRTKNLTDVHSWRAWNGREFGATFVNPYTLEPGADVSRHLCTVLEESATGLPRGQRGKPLVNQGLVWSEYLSKFIAVMWNTGHDVTIGGGAPFVFAISEDLLRWSDVAPLPLPQNLPTGSLAYPSLLDPSMQHSPMARKGFDRVGRTPSLYFALANPKGTGIRQHWDALVSVDLDFGVKRL